MVANYFSLRNFSFLPEYGAQYTREFISSRGVIKIQETDTEINIGLVEGYDSNLVQYLEGFHIPKKAFFHVITKADFAEYIGGTTEVSMHGESKISECGIIDIETVNQDAPVVNIINSMCIEAIRLGASDIHIESMRENVLIRYRIDGLLRVVKKLDKEIFSTISNRIKIMADLNSMEKRLPQDGRLTLKISGTTIDIRVSTIPISNGESIVLRLFNKSSETMTVDTLGFSQCDFNMICDSIKRPNGLILLTGPTGSGKTTTLHALLQTLPHEDLKIITIEDPVEHVISGVNQIQINTEINLGFDTMLRRVLRQDPNVIMVGEIRDTDTAEIALRSALTGHLILSTLHTNDSISVITRLSNMGIEPYLIAAVLKYSVAQRLVRKVCPSCTEKVSMPKKIRDLCDRYGIIGKTMNESKGCPACNYTGFRGRTVVAEVFEVTQSIEHMISSGEKTGDILKHAIKAGMKTMAYDALIKLSQGVTTYPEIQREVLL
ncbi:MAG TPA: type II/IV secretion system protein [Treponema sp.]|nr:type II/IV secretion system protein [Treponema sp.]HKM22024.1 GspE/PulE family protein [Lachnospiraceae bacterium]